ncbi:epidermal growth factor-like protein 7 [Lingula anatina]|uniref:Epidermal growth factor-like protein 7 n=1 Tax=Lingula anatina TaxID=7574 RepID=A0A1S3HHY8_LINAN|nr:epidermal growth factor-like protein 7 [Lingula anatina]|eukprot:XP_013384604.1 epidermal growth factor-like protein 7 [Lingula anatina]
MAAVCSKECGSGFCVQPDRCKCPAGWTGKDCKTDIDECKSGEHGCSHKCVNTEGSFSCTCSDGFSLGADGKSCEFCLSCSKEYKLLDKKLQKLSSEVENLQQENKALKSDLKAILHNATKVDLDPIGLKEFLTPETSSTKPTTKEAAATVVITTGKLPPVATTTMQPTRSPQESEVSFIFSNLKDMKTEMETRFYSMSAQLSVLEERLSDCKSFLFVV